MRLIILAAVLLARPVLGGPANSVENGCALEFHSREEGERVVISAVSRDSVMPYHVEVNFPVLVNLQPSCKLPGRFVVPPATELDLMWLDRIDPDRASRMEVTYLCGMGDPDADQQQDHVYLFPFAHGTKFLLSQGYMGSFTHKDSHALDFQMPEGTEVCAARAGRIVKIKQDSEIGGPGLEYRKAANHVIVLHIDGTWACYSHLKTGGVYVEIGEAVDAGRVLALSGATGQVSGPHLHFAVCRAGWGEGSEESLPVKFISREGRVISPKEGEFYYSVHPGGPPFEAILGAEIRDEDLAGHDVAVAEDGRVHIRVEEIDHKIFLYCANGTDSDQRVTLNLLQLKNLEPSRSLPYTRLVPAGREAFMLSLVGTFKPGRSEWDKFYKMEYSWVPAGSVKPRWDNCE